MVQKPAIICNVSLKGAPTGDRCEKALLQHSYVLPPTITRRHIPSARIPEKACLIGLKADLAAQMPKNSEQWAMVKMSYIAGVRI
jgi:hypothetical protein